MQEGSCGLDQCFLCRHCLPEWKNLVVLKKQTLVYKKGKKIIQEGEPVQGIFFINEGSVKVFRKWGEEKELILRFAKTGDVLGHRGFGGDAFYPISAVAMEDCKVCFIDGAFLEASLTANTAFTYELMKLYAMDLQKAEKRMSDLAHREVKGRIVLALFEIMEVFGVNEDGFVSVPISRQDIASYAGTTYETVFKFFTDLSDKNILTTNGKSIKINDQQNLQAFLNVKAKM